MTAPTPARATHEPLIEALEAAFAEGAVASVANNPPRNATTAVCEIRLSRDVFVDIDFLSLVVDETFPPTAGKDWIFAS